MISCQALEQLMSDSVNVQLPPCHISEMDTLNRSDKIAQQTII